ncbi:MAG: hypothetical protein ACLPXZ_02750 [Mycobacterium sp.]
MARRHTFVIAGSQTGRRLVEREADRGPVVEVSGPVELSGDCAVGHCGRGVAQRPTRQDGLEGDVERGAGDRGLGGRQVISRSRRRISGYETAFEQDKRWCAILGLNQ